MSNAQHKTVRLPPDMLERLEAIAQAKDAKVSDVMRWALQRGLTVLEQEIATTAPARTSVVVAPRPKRRMISRGIL